MKLTKMLNNVIRTVGLNMFVSVLFLPVALYAQAEKTLTLDSLQQMARENYPYVRQLMLNSQQGQEAVKSVRSNWLPDLSVSGKTTLQSEYTFVSLPSAMLEQYGINMGSGKKFQYQGSASVNQLIYDGGINRASGKLKQLESEIEGNNIQLSMLQVEDAVNALFENILVSHQQLKMLNFQKTDLKGRKKNLQAAVENGIVLQSVLLELQSEILHLEQQKTEVKSALVRFYSHLSFFTQQQIDTAIVMQQPALIADCGEDFSARPDFRKFAKRVQVQDWQLKMLRRQSLPKLSFFANGYWGRPGLNMMKYDNHFWGITGINLKWNLNHLYDFSHDKNKVELQRSIIKNQQNIFEIEMSRQLADINNEIFKNRQLLTRDDEVVKTRTEIKETAAVQLENGAITFSDYLTKLTDESRAVANRNIHKIQLSMNFFKKRTLIGGGKH